MLRDTILDIGKGRATIKADVNLKSQDWQGVVNTSAIALTPFLSQLAIEGVDLTRPIVLQNSDIALSGKLNDFAPETIQGKVNLDLDVDGSNVALQSQLASGDVKAVASTGAIAINNFLPTLPLPVTLSSSEMRIVSKVKPLLNLGNSFDFSSVISEFDADVIVADGLVKVKGSTANNLWQADIKGNEINTKELANTFAPDLPQDISLDRLDTQANLSGSLAPLQNKEVLFPIDINNAVVQMGTQSMSSKGKVLISNLLNSLDIDLVDLAVNSNLDVDSLPIEEFVVTATQNLSLIHI